MSDHVPQQPDLAAVRALRRAAASLGEPLGALSLAIAAAEALPSTLAPSIDLVGFLPFASLGGVAVGVKDAQEALAAASRRKAPRSGAPAGGGLLSPEMTRALAAAAAPAQPSSGAGKSPPPAEGFFPAVVDVATKVATTATAVATASVEAVAGQGPGASAKPAPRPAATGPADTISGAIGLLGELVGQIEDTTARNVAGVVGAPPAPPSRSVGGNILEAVTSAVGKAIETTAGVAGPQGAAVGRTIAEGISKATDVVAPPQPTLYDMLSASLLMVELETMRTQAEAAAPAGGRAPAAGASPGQAAAPGSPAQAAAPTPAVNGTVVQAAATPDPGELAWLVNEALIEQARRHGMDLFVKVKPVLGGWEIPHIASIGSVEQRSFAELEVPGKSTSLFHDLAATPTRIVIGGSLFGDEDRDSFLQEVRDKFRAGDPVTFVADIVTATEIQYVVIETLRFEQSASRPDEIEYLIALRESPPPPPPPAAGLDDGLLDEAGGFLDSVTGALGAIDAVSVPGFGDPTPPLSGTLDGTKAALEGLADVPGKLTDLFGSGA